jgi:hypothetical protein
MSGYAISRTTLALFALPACAIVAACSAGTGHRDFACPAVLTAGPQILYPENGARNVSVNVGELLDSGSQSLGTFYLQSPDTALAVTTAGIAPTPYPSPMATPYGPGGPIYRATFGKLAPATTYTVRLRAPDSNGPCGSDVGFSPTSFTTK